MLICLFFEHIFIDFFRKNTNCSIEESQKNLKAVAQRAIKNGLKVRGYVSTVIACPYEGFISSKIVAKLANEMIEFGCYEGFLFSSFI